jgi:hypothetical protein
MIIAWRACHSSVGENWAICGVAMIVIGCCFSQTAFYAWWTLRTANINFAMIGSLLYSLGIIFLIYCSARADSLHCEKQKEG